MNSMKKNFIILCTVYLLLFSFQLRGQNDNSKINFDFELRERFELWNGMNTKNYGDDSPEAIGTLNDKILYQRVIAGLVYHPIPNFNIAAHLQDSRAFGWSLRNAVYPDLFKVRKKNTETPYYIRNPNEEFFEIHDFYIEYCNIFNKISVKAGRQKIFYGDKRIFGPGEWGNTGRWTWDALKISYQNDNHYIDIFGGGTKIHNPEIGSIPFTQTEFLGGGLYAHFRFKNIISIEPFYALKKPGSANYINKLNFTRNWAGLRIYKNNIRNFMYDLSFSKEFGNENGLPIDAFGIVIKVGYQFDFIPTKPILAIRESYASGSNYTDSKIKTFEPVYGSRDSYYGRMNITSWSNLDDKELILFLFPVKNMKIEFNYHWLYIPETVNAILLGTLKLQDGKHHLGNEFNIFAKYQVLDQLQALAAFGYFGPGNVQLINNDMANDATWFTFQLHWKFNG
ncbi:MAG: alginate export family protein [Bacteroidota bacterium]